MKKLLLSVAVALSAITSNAQFTKLLDFDGTNGKYPFYGTLAISGNVLYGMTNQGGTNGKGNIFSINTDGTGYKDLHDFNDTTDGYEPMGSLTLSGNVLYGMTNHGNSVNAMFKDNGVIFSINTDGSGYKILLDFGMPPESITGPTGSLTVSGSVLFGMSSTGGGAGDIFSVNTDGTGFMSLHHFSCGAGVYPNGDLTLS